MTALTVSRKSASPAAVRAFALENGLSVGSRGRFSADLIAAFNAKHKGFGAYRPGAFEKVAVAEVVTKDKRGRKVVRKVNVKAARALLAEHEAVVGKRGRLSQADLQHALDLASGE